VDKSLKATAKYIKLNVNNVQQSIQTSKGGEPKHFIHQSTESLAYIS